MADKVELEKFKIAPQRPPGHLRGPTTRPPRCLRAPVFLAERPPLRFPPSNFNLLSKIPYRLTELQCFGIFYI